MTKEFNLKLSQEYLEKSSSQNYIYGKYSYSAIKEELYSQNDDKIQEIFNENTRNIPESKDVKLMASFDKLFNDEYLSGVEQANDIAAEEEREG